MKKYSTLRNYKFFKKEYTHFVVFVKCGTVLKTYDSDALIVHFLLGLNDDKQRFVISKYEFRDLLHILLKNGLNVAVVGWKNAQEYYCEEECDYVKIRNESKNYFRNKENATISGVHY